MAKSVETDGTFNVPRPRKPPQPDELLDEMVVNRCYVVADLVAEFEAEHDPNRSTVRNRLEHLTERGDVDRVKHENGTVTYRRVE